MKHIIFALPTWFYLGCDSTKVLYAATYHTTLNKNVFFSVDEPKYTTNGLPACIVLLTMFVYFEQQ